MNTKLGRCECEDADCVLLAPGKGAKTDHTSFKSWRCQRDAVRMVTLKYQPESCGPKDTATRLRLCAACADFHETKGD